MADDSEDKENQGDGEDGKATVVLDLNALKEELSADSSSLDSLGFSFGGGEEKKEEAQNPPSPAAPAQEEKDINAIFEENVGSVEGFPEVSPQEETPDEGINLDGGEKTDGGFELESGAGSGAQDEAFADKGGGDGIKLDFGGGDTDDFSLEEKGHGKALPGGEAPPDEEDFSSGPSLDAGSDSVSESESDSDFEPKEASQTRTFEFKRPDPVDLSFEARAPAEEESSPDIFSSKPAESDDNVFEEFVVGPPDPAISTISTPPREFGKHSSPPPPPPPSSGPTGHFDHGLSDSTLSSLNKANADYVAYHESELVKLSAIIRNLREDREVLLKKMEAVEGERSVLKQENINLAAELEELKIGLALSKKRQMEELENMKYQLRLGQNKKEILEEQNRNFQMEFDRLRQKVKVDFRKIKEREKELENQLELLKADSQAQISSRENKILELKRQIDSMEFDMENIMSKDQKDRQVQHVLEDKLEKVRKMLRNGIGLLEKEEFDLEHPEAANKMKY